MHIADALCMLSSPHECFLGRSHALGHTRGTEALCCMHCIMFPVQYDDGDAEYLSKKPHTYDDDQIDLMPLESSSSQR